MVPELAPELEQRLFIRFPQPGVLHHRMRNAGVSQLQIHATDLFPVHIQRQILQVHRVRQANAIVFRVDARAGHKPGSRFNRLRFACKTGLIAVAADAAGAVAAHLPHGAVGVEEQHPIIAAAGRRLHHHEAVGPDGQMPLAQGAGQLRPAVVRHGVPPVIHHDKVVARAVHLPEFHGVSPLRARPRRDAFMRSIPQGAAERTCFPKKYPTAGAWGIFLRKQPLRHRAGGAAMYGWRRISPTGW